MVRKGDLLIPGMGTRTEFCTTRHGVKYDGAMVREEIPQPEGSRWHAFKSNPDHPACPRDQAEVWISRQYLVQRFADRGYQLGMYARLSIRRLDGREIREAWDELQKIKNEIVGPEDLCIEVYPPESRLHNVANIRHLWVFPPICTTELFLFKGREVDRG